MREENTHFSCRICEKWAVQPCALHTYDKDTREIGSRVEPEDPSRLAPGVEVAGVVAVGDTVVSLADVAEAGNIVEPSSTADVFTGVVGASRGDSEEVLETGVVVMRNGSGVNIVGLMESKPVLLDSITVSENQSSKFAQLGHTSSCSRWSSKEYFR
jgi:hypothetical protein